MTAFIQKNIYVEKILRMLILDKHKLTDIIFKVISTAEFSQ